MSMTLTEARRRHERFVAQTRKRTPKLVLSNWTRSIREEEWSDCWVFVYRDADRHDPETFEAVIVRKDGAGCHILIGAISKLFRLVRDRLGLPRSNERWLGSGPGRYQLFDNGLSLWDQGQDLAYPRILAEDVVCGRQCNAFVAFTDLRGFTAWSSKPERKPREIQRQISQLEDLLQDAFAQSWCGKLFIKGVGDGLMIVSEALPTGNRWFEPSDTGCRIPEGHLADHAWAFLEACAQFVRAASRAVKKENLAVGCGIDFGPMSQVWLLGQTDYLGQAVNNASKLQQLAWDEIIISPEFRMLLANENERTPSILRGAMPLANCGFRIHPDDLIRPRVSRRHMEEPASAATKSRRTRRTRTRSKNRQRLL